MRTLGSKPAHTTHAGTSRASAQRELFEVGEKNSKQTHVILDSSFHVSPFFSLPDLECECAFLFFEFPKVSYVLRLRRVLW